jgi:hypothetical protein
MATKQYNYEVMSKDNQEIASLLTEGDAQLIAEAPAMFDLLRSIVSHFGDECHHHVPLMEAERLIDRIEGKPESDFSGVEF